MAALSSPADAAITLKPRTYTAVMTPTTAVPGQATAYAVVVKNTSTVISALDHFVLTAPTGFIVTPGAVTAPRGGWTESFSNGDLTAKTTQPLRYALRKGESMTVRFSATSPASCTSSTATWVQKADGIIIDPFVAQSPNPTVQLTPVADNVKVTSVQDRSSPPLDHQVVKGQPFDVTGTFYCNATPAPAPGGTLSLAKTGPGTPDNGGTLTSSPVTVTAGAASATISGSYSQLENQVPIALNWTAGTGDSFALDVLGDADTTNASPGTSVALSVSGASASLGNGATGPVSLTVVSCTGQDLCTNGVEIDLTGTFKDGQSNLYGFGAAAVEGGPTPKPTDTLAPAVLTRTCPASQCPHPDSEAGQTDYYYNYTCPGTSCRVSSSDLFGEREVEEDFAAYPTYVSLRVNGVYQPFAQAPRCVPPSDLTTTNTILTAQAQNAGFCVDVNAIDRAPRTFAGDLKIPVLFVEDPKLRP